MSDTAPEGYPEKFDTSTLDEPGVEQPPQIPEIDSDDEVDE